MLIALMWLGNGNLSVLSRPLKCTSELNELSLMALERTASLPTTSRGPSVLHPTLCLSTWPNSQVSIERLLSISPSHMLVSMIPTIIHLVPDLRQVNLDLLHKPRRGALSAPSACADASGSREFGDILTVLVTAGELFPSAVVFFLGGVDSLLTIFTSIKVLVNSLQSSSKRRGTSAFYRDASFVSAFLVPYKTTMEGEFCSIVSRNKCRKCDVEG